MKKYLLFIIAFILVGIVWNQYFYGIHRNKYSENLVIISTKGDTLHSFKNVDPGNIKLIFKDRTLEITNNEGVDIFRYPDNAQVHIQELKTSTDTIKWILM